MTQFWFAASTEQFTPTEMLEQAKAAGQLDKAAMLTHPNRHKIYNCLGGDKQPLIDLAQTSNLLEGDTLLLCSDGLWTVLDDSEIADILHSGTVTDTTGGVLGWTGGVNYFAQQAIERLGTTYPEVEFVFASAPDAPKQIADIELLMRQG